MLRLGILIDAAAEVPADVLANPHVRLLPITVQIDEQSLVDRREAAATRQFNANYLSLRAAEVSRSVPPSSDEVARYMLSEVACDFEHMFGLFVTSSRSPIFKNAFDASSRVIGESVAVRAKAGLKGPLFVECYDSQNLFGGYGVQVLEALRQFEAQPTVASVRAQMQQLSGQSYAYVAPSQLDFVLTRAKAKGEQSVGMLGQAAAKMLGVLPVLRAHQGQTAAVAKVRGVNAARDHALQLARRELQRGLRAPFIVLSYSGNVEDVRAWAQYQVLVDEAAAKGVQVSLIEMSPTNSINLGPNALTVGFIAAPHEATL